jgi:hypothetical protein
VYSIREHLFVAIILIMYCCEYHSYSRVPTLTKPSPYIKITSVHDIEDGEYNVNEDYWHNSIYGLRRVLTLEQNDGKVLYVRISGSSNSPKASLAGGSIVKRSLKHVTSYYGEVFIIDFKLKRRCI